MQSVICHNVANLYAEPDDRSECISQLIMNDEVQALEEKAGFVYIEGRDGYQGWVRNEHVLIDRPKPVTNAIICLETAHIIWDTNSIVINSPQSRPPITTLVLGTRLYELGYLESYPAWHRVQLPGLHQESLFYHGWFDPLDTYHPPMWEARRMVGYAKYSCIGVPYLWGGTTTFGFDCSGLTQRLYGLWDIVLPRDAYLQYESPLGDILSDGEAYQPGDLVFWVGKTDPRNRGITHVGIMMDETRVIHAYSKMGVIVTPLAEMTSKLGYTYRGAWRYRSETADE